MIAPVVLVGLAACLALLAPPVLRDARWVHRAPRAGVTVWVLTVGTMAMAVVAAGVTATFPLLHHLGGFRELFHRCPVFFDALRTHLSYLMLAAGGLLLSMTAVAVGVTMGVRQVRVMRRLGRDHALAVRAVGIARAGYSVVPGAAPAAWSLAMDGGHVVITEAAENGLDPVELQAVLAHEHAHLRGRDHLIRTLMSAAVRAMPCPLTRAAADQTAELLEMAADDMAARRFGPGPVARALLILSGASPAGALGAGGTATRSRLDRLLEPASPAGWPRVVAVAAAAAGLTIPAATVAMAAWGVLALHVCPLAD